MCSMHDWLKGTTEVNDAPPPYPAEESVPAETPPKSPLRQTKSTPGGDWSLSGIIPPDCRDFVKVESAYQVQVRMCVNCYSTPIYICMVVYFIHVNYIMDWTLIAWWVEYVVSIIIWKSLCMQLLFASLHGSPSWKPPSMGFDFTLLWQLIAALSSEVYLPFWVIVIHWSTLSPSVFV